MQAKKRVFLIDDESDMTNLMSTLLIHKGFEVISSNDAEKGMLVLLESPCDAVILDLMMPRVDGFTIIARLRTSALHFRTPIVVLSAKHLGDDERKRLLTAGVRYVPKPVSPSRLVEILKDCLAASAK